LDNNNEPDELYKYPYTSPDPDIVDRNVYDPVTGATTRK
jgi:hypothetical protein